MRKLIVLSFFLSSCLSCLAKTIPVKNIDELNTANKQAQPGDVIILQNGVWRNVQIKLTCNGTKEAPVHFKAQTNGKVTVSGLSSLRIGGNHLIVEGLYFTNGYAAKDAVISFRAGKEQVANHSRVTNCVIESFNNPKRMEDNNWVLFYGKNNQLDHCSFRGKKNMGVLLAVMLDDDRSRENFHSINHNYFGERIPLGSNGGEIIRVGVSQHCEFNSNTQILNNYFEYCDGETEIVSIKSGSNIVKDNVFKECQGSVVLRHGDNNTVSHNYFIGNDKPGTGGVRIINKGQKVTSNVFYKCRGVDFRSPLAIMNGIPNSPAHRYVQVTDAFIRDNVFFECAPVTFCEGSDTERTLPPSGVVFERNDFYNSRDSIIYKAYDDITGFRFINNATSQSVVQPLPKGFDKVLNPGSKLPLSARTAVSLMDKSYSPIGANWFSGKAAASPPKKTIVNCNSTAEISHQLAKKIPLTIVLTNQKYTLSKPLLVESRVQFISNHKKPVVFEAGDMQSVFIIAGGGNLIINNLRLNGSKVSAKYFIASDSTGSSSHYNLAIKNTTISNFSRSGGCVALFFACKNIIADSIIVHNNNFLNNNCNGFLMNDETDNKGYYSAEKVFMGHNIFTNQAGTLLSIYRGGNDESTLGPDLVFSHNKITTCNTTGASPLIELTGVQQTKIFSNQFSGSNSQGILIYYKDFVRADHRLERNILIDSGKIAENKFVKQTDNKIK
ncbi:MAG: polysaccharide lyase 6 family protein [Chitinophagales bacterium]|nr:polysaccharide lyase 6 family protein [Chitinophagales bacterium]